MSNYSRNCRDCGRRINLREMPHGQWVAFEGDRQHKCDEPASDKVGPVRVNRPRPAEPATEPFKPLYPKISEIPISDPVRSQPTSPQEVNSSTIIAGALPPRPAPVPRLTSPPGAALLKPIGTGVMRRPTGAPQSVMPRDFSSRPRTDPSPTRPPFIPQPAPTQKSSALATILALITGLFGSTFGLVIAAFALLSLPLNVIAVMHLFGWSWFGALICVVLFSCIPFFGQLGYFIFAIMGAYYLWTADFDWQRSTYPPTKTFSVSALSDIELERFKSDVVRPGFERACKSESLKTSGFDGKIPTRLASLCECFATNFAAKLSRDDMIGFEKSGQYPDEVQQRLGPELRRACDK